MIDFGPVDAVDAEAIGPPGRRTFRLRARVGDSYAALWMEKEQLGSLGRLFSQILAERSRLRGRPADPVEGVGNFPQRPQVDFQVARLGLDYDADVEHVIILADDPGAGERGDTPSFRMEITRAQAIAAIAQIEQIVSAGRPLCPLCKEPLGDPDEEHFCPRKNGHSAELEIPDLEEEEEGDDEDDVEDDDEEEDAEG